MRIALGSDHRGFNLKQIIIRFLAYSGYEYKDFGAFNEKPTDYPDIALEVATQVSLKVFDFGILICGTGIGMCIVANKVKNIRAAVCKNVIDALRSRQHNDANVLCLGADSSDKDLILDIVNTFLITNFEGGRHLRRIKKILDIESL